MDMDSIVIEDRSGEGDKAGNRIYFLYSKFFLELVGYKVLEERTYKLVSTEECGFQKIIFVNQGEKDENENGAVQLEIAESTNGKYETLKNIVLALCGKLKSSEKDGVNLRKIADYYNSDIGLFRELYTICYLYSSRYVNYGGEETLKFSSQSLAHRCGQKEKELDNENYTWRDLYAYLYMTNRVNEGLYKLRAYSYRPYYMLKKRITELKNIAPDYGITLLLESEIVRNTEFSIRQHYDFFQRLQDSSSYCTRFWAKYAKAELYMESADNKYRDVYGDDDLRIRVQYNEQAMQVFKDCLKMKEDEIKIVYKLALQEERRSLSDRSYQDIARELFKQIANEIGQIPTGQRTTLEFEYLYKTYLRIGYLYKIIHALDNAEKAYSQAENIWKDMEDYTLFSEIYGNDNIEPIKKVLMNRHSTRDMTIKMNKDEIELLMKM